MRCALLLLAVLAAGCGKPSASNDPTTGDRWPVAELTAGGMLSEYQSQIAADRAYKGKAVLVTGSVKATRDTPAGPLVELNDGSRFAAVINCYFSSKSEAASLKAGSTAQVLGKCVGLQGGIVVIEACELVDDVSKYRYIPKALSDRHETMTSVAAYGDRVPLESIREHAGQVIDVYGPLSRPQFFNEADPTAIISGVTCHFPAALAAEVKRIGGGWPVRARGKVVGAELFDCGLVYNAR